MRAHTHIRAYAHPHKQNYQSTCAHLPTNYTCNLWGSNRHIRINIIIFLYTSILPYDYGPRRRVRSPSSVLFHYFIHERNVWFMCWIINSICWRIQAEACALRSAHSVENKFDPLYTVPKSIESPHKNRACHSFCLFAYIYVHTYCIVLYTVKCTGLLHLSCGDSDYFWDNEFCFVEGHINNK